MKEFLFLSYYTEYSCSGEVNKEMNNEACFGRIFREIPAEDIADEKYVIILYQGTKFASKERCSNACLFNKQQIINHLKQIKDIAPFTFKVKEIVRDGYPAYELTVIVNQLPGIYHKYILAWIRYLYEFPFNVILWDAYKLKQTPKFRFTSISDLFNVVRSSYGINGSIHLIAIGRTCALLRKQKIKEKLDKVNQLNDIYKKLDVKPSLIPEEVKHLTKHDIEYWEKEEIYEKYRKPAYLDTYKKITEKQ